MSSSRGGNDDDDAVLGRMLLEAFLDSELSQRTGNSLRDRGNTPSPLKEDMILDPGSARPDKVWIMDRVLEPQTLPHFFEAVCMRKFPDGQTCEIPCPTVEEMVLLSQYYTDWAPAPYSALEGRGMDRMMERVASFQYTANLFVVSSTLYNMKSRLWEGIVPLSNQQWVKKGLDRPENFPEACQYISWVIKVFQYLNHPRVAAGMRKTFNSIHEELKNFEDAINAYRLQRGGEPDVQIRAAWTAYIRAHFDYITRTAHAWVLDRISRLRIPIIEDIRNHTSSAPDNIDDRVWELTNKIHDLGENAAQADLNIMLLMQGYNGVPAFDDPDALYGDPPPNMPLSGAHPITKKRKELYHMRLRYLTRLEQQGGDSGMSGFQSMLPTMNASFSSGLVCTLEAQMRGQAQARLELRGGQQPPRVPFWIDELRRQMKSGNFQWAYVGYRASHHCSNGEWEEFKKRFDAHQKDWGVELGDVEDIRTVSKVHWLDTKTLGVDGVDLDSLRIHFKEYVKTADAPPQIYDDMFLVADQVSIDSYLRPVPEQDGFVLAIDVEFDPTDTDRAEESPGYDGTLRILPSLLWNDINPMILLQTQHLRDLWPLAMPHPLHVYSGPVMPASRNKWEAIARARKILFASANKWRELCGAGGENAS